VRGSGLCPMVRITGDGKDPPGLLSRMKGFRIRIRTSHSHPSLHSLRSLRSLWFLPFRTSRFCCPQDLGGNKPFGTLATFYGRRTSVLTLRAGML